MNRARRNMGSVKLVIVMDQARLLWFVCGTDLDQDRGANPRLRTPVEDRDWVIMVKDVKCDLRDMSYVLGASKYMAWNMRDLPLYPYQDNQREYPKHVTPSEKRFGARKGGRMSVSTSYHHHMPR